MLKAFLIFALLSGLTLISTGVARAVPPDFTICDGLSGASFGVCRAGVAVGCATEQLDRVIAQGFLSQQIVLGSRGYQCNGLAQQAIQLGVTLDEIRASLSQHYPWLIRLHRDFALALAQDPTGCLQRIDEALAEKTATSDPILDQLDTNRIQETQQLAQALLPYLRRLVLTEGEPYKEYARMELQ